MPLPFAFSSSTIPRRPEFSLVGLVLTVLVFYANWAHQLAFSIVQDNAWPRAKSMWTVFGDEGIDTIRWPTGSPDLSLIEQHFGAFCLGGHPPRYHPSSHQQHAPTLSGMQGCGGHTMYRVCCISFSLLGVSLNLAVCWLIIFISIKGCGIPLFLTHYPIYIDIHLMSLFFLGGGYGAHSKKTFHLLIDLPEVYH